MTSSARAGRVWLVIVAVTSGCLAGAQGAAAQSDGTPPETTITEGPADGSTIETDAPRFAWASSEDGSTFACIADGVKLSSCEQAFARGAADGPHSFSVAATDPAGNTDPTPAMRAFTVQLGSAPPQMPGCPIDGRTVLGTNADDALVGTAGTDIMFGLRGNDLLRGGSRPDCLSGQAGADRLFGGSGGDFVFGGSGNDVANGGSFNDVLEGGSGGDRLSDSSGRDSFDGGAGNDRIQARDATAAGRRVADSVRCGPGGRDVALVDRADTVARDCERVRRR